MSVYPHVVGGSVTEDQAGRRVVELWRVADVSAAAASFLVAAIDQPGLPRLGAQLRADPRLFCQSRTLQPGGDPDDLVVRVEYGPQTNEGGSASVGATTRSVRADTVTEVTATDLDGRKMITRYVSRLSFSLTSSSISISTIVHEVEVQRPTVSLVWNRIESNWIWPGALSYVGHVNSTPYLGLAPDTWLLTARSTEQQAGRHSVEYTMTYNAEGWQAVILHNEGGRIPLDVGPGNGREVRQVYPRYDFQRLRLPT